MRFTRTSPDGTQEIEISDLAAVVAVIGVIGRLVIIGWMATRDQRLLEQAARIAESRGVRLLRGR